MRDRDKITTGLNDRPLNDTIGQTGEGLPDDSSQPIEVDPAEAERVRAKLMGEDRPLAAENDSGEDAKVG